MMSLFFGRNSERDRLAFDLKRLRRNEQESRIEGGLYGRGGQRSAEQYLYLLGDSLLKFLYGASLLGKNLGLKKVPILDLGAGSTRAIREISDSVKSVEGLNNLDFFGSVAPCVLKHS